MERISESINKIYNKYLPIVKRMGISLDIDFPDTTLTIRERERIERDIEKSMQSAVSRSKNNGRIMITVRPGCIIITDNGTILSKTTCEILTTEHVKVKSRVGFGTIVTINTKRQEKPAEPKELKSPKESKEQKNPTTPKSCPSKPQDYTSY